MGKRYLRNYNEQSLVFGYFKNKCVKKGFAKDFDDDFYDELNLKIGDITIGKMIEKSNTYGRCYFYALLLAKGLEGSTLVHGTLHKLDISVKDEYYDEFKHAWVEKDGYVYDTTAKTKFLKDVYYNKMQVETENFYTHDELAENTTFVKLGLYSIAVRPVLKNRLEKICREWEIPLPEKMENVQNEDDKTPEK